MGTGTRSVRRPGLLRRTAIEPLEPRMLLSAVLVQDVNAVPQSSGGAGGGYFDAGNGVVYFIRTPTNADAEYWWMNVNTGQSAMFFQSFIGPHTMGKAGNWIMFTGENTEYGRELWRTDGTPQGTTRLTDLWPGAYDSFRFTLGECNGRLIWGAADPQHGCELWSTDGTPEGTLRVLDLLPGPDDGADKLNENFPVNRRFSDGSLAFYGNDGVHRGVFKTDGTPAGTQLVLDLATTPDPGEPWETAILGSYACVSSYSRKLYVSDGSNGGAPISVDFPSGFNLLAHDGSFYFTRTGRLFRLEAGSTVPVEVLEAGTNAPLSGIGESISWAGALWSARYTATGGYDLYCVDPGETQARFVADVIAPGTSGKLQRFMPGGNRLYFFAGKNWHHGDLWSVDMAGQSAGPVYRPDGAVLWVTEPSPFNSGLIVSSHIPGGNTPEIWTIDGGAPQRIYVGPLSGSNGSASPQILGTTGNRLFFTADDGYSGIGFYVTNGTSSGTQILYRIGDSGSEITDFTPVSSGKVFFGVNESGGPAPWVTDGTSNGTFRLAETNASNGASDLSDFVELNGVVYFFSTSSTTTGRELWRSDGTSAGTWIVKDSVPGPLDGIPNTAHTAPTRLANRLFYPGSAGSSQGVELWCSDGTASGTSQFLDINPGPASSNPQYFMAGDDSLFFVATTPAEGTELWVTDGTTTGTTMIADLTPGPDPTWVFPPIPLFHHDGLLYFSLPGADERRQLWRTDGTAAGTMLLADLAVSHMVELNGAVYFLALDGPPDPLNKPGSSLYKTDGTPGGTVRVRRIHEDDGGYNWYGAMEQTLTKVNLAQVNGRLFFIGQETLWISDGTAAGTCEVRDLVPDVPQVTGNSLASLGGEVYFAGNSGTAGIELFKLLDTFAPMALETDYDPLAAKQSLSFRFNEDVGGSIAPEDLVLTQLSTEQPGGLSPAGIDLPGLAYDPETHTVTFFPSSYWPSGSYRAALPASQVADAAGNLAAADIALEFTVVNGDADQNGHIDIDDYFAIDRGYALRLAGYANGDFNYSGTIDADDYHIIDQAFLGQGSPQGIASPEALSAPVPMQVFSSGMIAPESEDASVLDGTEVEVL